MSWLESITNSMDMNLRKHREILKEKRTWCAAVHGVVKSQTQLSGRTTTRVPALKTTVSACNCVVQIFLVCYWTPASRLNSRVCLSCSWLWRQCWTSVSFCGMMRKFHLRPNLFGEYFTVSTTVHFHVSSGAGLCFLNHHCSAEC